MGVIDISRDDTRKDGQSPVADKIRTDVLRFAKDFKTSWVELGQALYTVHRDKLYYAWDYDKFDDYTEKEVGIKKATCMKLLKAYLFLEEDEPVYLKKEFIDEREPNLIPDYEGIDLLRTAKSKKELNKEDYSKLRRSLFDKGKETGAVRKDLTALMKERKVVDPDKERQMRSQAALRRLINSIRSFKKDAETLKLLPNDVLKEAEGLLARLEKEVDD